MPKLSAGLIVYRLTEPHLEVLIVHMGGPFWAKKDEGAWSVPKGEYEDGEDPWAVALREFEEETGQPAPQDNPLDLGVVKQPSGKKIQCWAVAGNVDITSIKSNEFEMEWPRGSGKMQSFPEIDGAMWASPDIAKTKVVKGQIAFIDLLVEALRTAGHDVSDVGPEPPTPLQLF